MLEILPVLAPVNMGPNNADPEVAQPLRKIKQTIISRFLFILNI